MSVGIPATGEFSESLNHQRIYRPTPLDAARQQIRLLRLQPGEFNENITCTLFRSSLHENRVYDALSYHWGTAASQRRIITLNGYTTSVTLNLDTALRHIRYRDKPRIIWCDALCINQKDIPERNQQVQQMASIYLAASQVLAWLGPAEGDSDLAMDLIDATLDDGSEEDENQVALSLSYAEVQRVMPALIDLFHRPWWNRIWIVQEFSVARTEPVVGCGHKWITFAAFRPFLETLRSMTSGLEIFQYHPMLDEVAKAAKGAISPLIACRDMYWRNLDLKPSLRWLLLLTAGFKSTDKRDKVYGIFGLTAESKSSGFRVDYAKDPYQVYVDVVRHIIVSEDSLDILDTYCAQQSPYLPSWVPDFSIDLTAIPGKFSAPFTFSDPNKRGHGVSGSHRPHIVWQRDPHKLTVQGLQVDTILDVIDMEASFKPAFSDDTTDEMAEEGFQRLFAIFPLLQSRAATLRKSMSSTDPRRFLSSPTFEFADIAANKVVPHDPAILDDLKSQWRVIMGQNNVPPDFESDKTLMSRKVMYCWQILSSTMVLVKNRCLFLTSNGFLGIGPRDARKGDVVAILFGAAMPFVLRKYWRHYALLGSCHVAGIMEGQLMSIHDHEKGCEYGMRSKFFTLC